MGFPDEGRRAGGRGSRKNTPSAERDKDLPWNVHYILAGIDNKMQIDGTESPGRGKRGFIILQTKRRACWLARVLIFLLARPDATCDDLSPKGDARGGSEGGRMATEGLEHNGRVRPVTARVAGRPAQPLRCQFGRLMAETSPGIGPGEVVAV